MDRLLTATIAVIQDKGLSGATVPEIAAAAGVATGSLYRRFTDKDDLFRAAFLNLLESTAEANRAGLKPQLFAGVPLETALRSVARSLIQQYRTHPALLKALDRFLETQEGSEFHARALELIAANFQLIVDAVSVLERQITRPQPRRAIAFALMSATTLIEMRGLHKAAFWDRALPLEDEALLSETTQLMFAYLTGPA